MPLVTTTEMFKKAYEGGYAIGAFNVNNMEIVQGITSGMTATAFGPTANCNRAQIVTFLYRAYAE